MQRCWVCHQNKCGSTTDVMWRCCRTRKHRRSNPDNDWILFSGSKTCPNSVSLVFKVACSCPMSGPNPPLLLSQVPRGPQARLGLLASMVTLANPGLAAFLVSPVLLACLAPLANQASRALGGPLVLLVHLAQLANAVSSLPAAKGVP
jgi:hypothetical protein